MNTDNFDDEKFVIDASAKLIVPMHRTIDRDGNPYFIGKLQFPGNISLEEGASLMLFVSEEGTEELQIGPLDPNKRSSKVRQNRLSMGPDDKIRIDLHSARDSKGNVFYIGEAIAPAVIPCRKRGIFFSAFTAQPGKEELQISSLRHRGKKDDSTEYESYEEENFESTG